MPKDVNNICSGEAALDAEEQGHLMSLSEKIKNGRVILFLGAAIHASPPAGYEEFYADADRPPMAHELTTVLEERLPPNMRNKNNSLSWVAQYYEIVAEDRPTLIKKLYDQLKDKKPSPLVKALAEMNFRYIITTNYDNLFEDALITHNKSVTNKGVYKPNKGTSMPGEDPRPKLTTDFPDAIISKDSPFIYKIHGDISEVVCNDAYVSEKDAIVLTDEDYIHFILRMGDKDSVSPTANYNPVPTSFSRALSDPNGSTVLFIGYSLTDYNLRLLFKSVLWKKSFESTLKKWSVDKKPDPTILKIFDRDYHITFIEKDAWCVIPFLYKTMFNRDMPI